MVWGQERPVPVRFTGTRGELGGMLLRGYVLLIPTIGLYRFWLTTWKRRFYWANTEIDGDPLEYTGNAIQLLLGFLMALAIFVPVYGLLFYLSTQSTEAALIGYGGLGVALWFMMGYAIYRARDFRLSRTLWRGIRCDQGGSAWNYAIRRFFWSLLVLVTAGLAYPFMAANLWNYRYRHSWYGDRQFGFVGSWKQLARPFYVTYIAIAVSGAAGLGLASSMGGLPVSGVPSVEGVLVLLPAAALIGVLVLYYQSRELSRMFSAVRLGQAALTVRVRARSLLGQYVLFGLALAGSYVVLAIGGLIVLGTVASGAFAGGGFDPEIFMQSLQGSFTVLVAIIFGYLLLLAAFSLMAELFLGLGFWKLVAQGASITGLDSLGDVKARGEDTRLGGEGLADALNVGAY
jgi:Predicted membrane protein